MTIYLYYFNAIDVDFFTWTEKVLKCCSIFKLEEDFQPTRLS